jgi:hypothetical protein
VQTNERIGFVPVAAGCGAAIDDDHAGFAFAQHGVGEGKGCRACADDDVICGQYLCHGGVMEPRRAPTLVQELNRVAGAAASGWYGAIWL